MINYRTYGNGDKAVVLVHGFLGGLGYWLPTVNHLSGMFRVVAVDLPGFAGSHDSPPQGTMEGFGDSVIEVLDSLGIDKFMLVGHSMGGLITLKMVLDHPDRIERFVLCGSAASVDAVNRDGALEGLIDVLATENLEQMAEAAIVRTWFAQGVDSPYYQIGLDAGRGVTNEAAIHTLKGVLGWDLNARLGEIKLPTLVIGGDLDQAVPTTEMIEVWGRIDGASLAILPGCAHNVHLDKPDLFNRVVADFLLEAPPAAPAA